MTKANAPAAPRAAVLAYHRVAEVAVDPWRLCVTPDLFAEQLEVIRREYHPIALQELVRDVASGDVAAGSVALTFDDGYADILERAVPALRAVEIPATAFVVSGKMTGDGTYWWDELERIFLHAGSLPASFELRIGDSRQRWDLGSWATLDPTALLGLRGWAPWRDPAPTPRHEAFLATWEALQRLSAGEREQVLSGIRAWAGLATVATTNTGCARAMTRREVGALAQVPNIEIGAHTRTHDALSALSVGAQRREIVDCKMDLEAVVGRPVLSFAYPFGRRGDYTASSVELVREAGFCCACANFPAHVTAAVDRFQIPRIAIGNWDGSTFARRLHDVLHARPPQ